MVPSVEESIRQQIVALLPRLLRFARGITGDPATADDIVQESCLRALTRLDQLKDTSRLESWLYRIVYTRWMDELRSRKRRVGALTLLENIARTETYKPDTPAATSIDVERAMQKLTPEHRVAVSLVSIAGYSYDEVADILDVPVGTVASRVARAREQLVGFLSSGRQQAA